MALQAGKIHWEKRTRYNLTFYKMEGKYYVRKKSRLTGKRVKKDPRFRVTMMNAGWLARASKIGSTVYKTLPESWRQFWMYREFTGEAMRMLKQGRNDEEVREVLLNTYVKPAVERIREIKDKKNKIINEKVNTKLPQEPSVLYSPFAIGSSQPYVRSGGYSLTPYSILNGSQYDKTGFIGRRRVRRRWGGEKMILLQSLKDEG